MKSKEYYYQEYEKNMKEIGIIIACAILGLFLAFIVCDIYKSGNDVYSKSDYVTLFLVIIPFPYGLYKSWNSTLVLTRGTSTMWFIWFIYITLKIIVAFLYGLIGMPIMLLAQIVSADSNKRKMKEALTLYQMQQQYNNQYYQ